MESTLWAQGFLRTEPFLNPPLSAKFLLFLVSTLRSLSTSPPKSAKPLCRLCR